MSIVSCAKKIRLCMFFFFTYSNPHRVSEDTALVKETQKQRKSDGKEWPDSNSDKSATKKVITLCSRAKKSVQSLHWVEAMKENPFCGRDESVCVWRMGRMEEIGCGVRISFSLTSGLIQKPSSSSWGTFCRKTQNTPQTKSYYSLSSIHHNTRRVRLR